MQAWLRKDGELGRKPGAELEVRHVVGVVWSTCHVVAVVGGGVTCMVVVVVYQMVVVLDGMWWW